MKDRIKQIREHAEEKKLTQSAFGERIGLTRDNVANIEGGRTEPTEIVIKSILREFNINETWLRTGEGQMKPPATRDDEIADIVKAAAKHDSEKALEFFQDFFKGFTDGEIVLLYEIFKKHFPE